MFDGDLAGGLVDLHDLAIRKSPLCRLCGRRHCKRGDKTECDYHLAHLVHSYLACFEVSRPSNATDPRPLMAMGFAIWLHGLELDVFGRSCGTLALRGGRACWRRAITLPFERDGAWRVLIPAWIAVVVRRKVLPDLHDGEHAAHFNWAELAETGHHRQ